MFLVMGPTLPFLFSRLHLTSPKSNCEKNRGSDPKRERGGGVGRKRGWGREKERVG